MEVNCRANLVDQDGTYKLGGIQAEESQGRRCARIFTGGGRESEVRVGSLAKEWE